MAPEIGGTVSEREEKKMSGNQRVRGERRMG
jgi:hypothetical protein